jgi:uncharacterized membrane protein YtjA (UPF0391 family)
VLAGYVGWVAGRGPGVNVEPWARDFVWAANLLEARMFGLLIGLIVIALVAGALGFTGVAAGAATAARIVFGIMVIGIIVVLILMAMGIAILT